MIYLAIRKLEGTKRSSGCLREIVEKYLEPHWTEGRAEDNIRVLLDGERVKNMLGDSWEYLKQVYDFYVQSGEERPDSKAFYFPFATNGQCF